MGKLFITGSSGFIGTNLCKMVLTSPEWSKRYDGVIGIDFDQPQWVPPQTNDFIFFQGDVSDEHTVRSIFKKYDIKHVVHLAAYASVPRSMETPIMYWENNVTAFGILLELCREKNARVVYASSSSVYGDPKTGKQLSPYALTKKFNDMQSELYARIFGVKTIGTTFFNVYGPYQKHQGAIMPAICHAAKTGDVLNKFGDGEASRSFCYVEDVCRACLAALTTRDAKAFGNTVDVGGHEVTTINELIEMSKTIMQKDFHVDECPERLGDIHSSAAKLQKGREMLNWEPKVTINDGIQKTWIFWQ